jgi:hypothetical protein
LTGDGIFHIGLSALAFEVSFAREGVDDLVVFDDQRFLFGDVPTFTGKIFLQFGLSGLAFGRSFAGDGKAAEGQKQGSLLTFCIRGQAVFLILYDSLLNSWFQWFQAHSFNG